MTEEEQKQFNSLKEEIAVLRGLKKTLRRNFQDMVGLLTTTISQSNNFLGGHIKRVSVLSKAFAEYMRYDKDTIYRVYYGALLHDIGLVGFPEKLLISSENSLSEAEQKLFKQHPLIGEKMILSAYDLRQTAQIVRSHHEEFGGDGFPDGLAGSEIPLGARITRLANDYDNFLYKDKIKASEAVERIKERSSYIYDPKLSTYFIKFIKTNVEKQDRSSESTGIPIRELRQGMYISEDISLENGMLLIPKGVIIDSSMLSKIQSFESLLNMNQIISIVG